MKKPLLILALVAHGAITAGALWMEGLTGIFAAISHSYWALQIFADLVVTLGLVMVWMWRDAKITGRNVWPWYVVTLVAGSFGPLLYFVTGKEKA